ncbi:hypothetical protein A2W24_02645 [Microgenomates group bacterium RBG_16_45_19]|nr:MAG: hypothetical protein A2W24_02645 [Microgenomates group bacterium RBG_16_45_19]
MKKQRVVKGSVRVGKRRQGVIWLARPSTISIIFLVFGLILISGALTMAGIPVVWLVWYRLQPSTSQVLAQVLKRPVTREVAVAEFQAETAYQPEVNSSSPKENRLEIASLGVATPLIEQPSDQYEAALRQGVWRVPDMGDPYNRGKPTILTAHRFGYLAWSNQYRRENSFFNLPKLKVGDRLEVIWNQRRYGYKVYGEGEGEEITDYQADLILYTCKFLESPVRIFKYARLVEI